MTVKYPSLVCNRAVTKNHEAVQCDCCDRWVYITCNYLNVYTYRKLQKDKSPWYCLSCLKKEMPFCSLKNEHLQELMHEKIIISPNKKIITNVIKKIKLYGPFLWMEFDSLKARPTYFTVYFTFYH